MLYNSSFPSWLFWKEYAWNKQNLKTIFRLEYAFSLEGKT